MIVDNIENLKNYAILRDIPEIDKIIKDPSILGKKDGRYDLENGCGVFYLIQHYVTLPKEQCRLEAHKKYVDLQWIISGEELIGHQLVRNDPKGSKLEQQYDQQGDAAFYMPDETMSYLKLMPGTFGVFFPQDAHMPKIECNKQSDVFKIVLKIPKELF